MVLIDLDKSTLHLLHRAIQAVDDVFMAEGADGITPRQALVLEAVAMYPGCSQRALVRVTAIDRSTIVDVVGRLVKRKLLKRRRSSRDARAYQVALTPEGAETVARLQSATERLEARILNILPTDRRKAFIQDLLAMCGKLP